MMALIYWKLFRGTYVRDVNHRPMVLLVKGDGDVTSCAVWINRRGKTRAYHSHNCQLLPGMSPHKTQTAAVT